MAAPASESIQWVEFLTSMYPGRECIVLDAVKITGSNRTVLLPAIKLYCDSTQCSGPHFFDCTEKQLSFYDPTLKFLEYRCRHCRGRDKIFAVCLREGESGQFYAIKYGENPSFGPHTPSRLISLIGPDKEFFLKGRRSETQGLGIAAFAYYRRVVENQKDRLISEIIRVFDKLGGPPEGRDALLKAKSETQFSTAVASIKDAIPDSLKQGSHNPLVLLHAALSEGLHSHDDDQCLELATSIRIVLTELAERIQETLLEKKELDQAVGRLLNPKKTL